MEGAVKSDGEALGPPPNREAVPATPVAGGADAHTAAEDGALGEFGCMLSTSYRVG